MLAIGIHKIFAIITMTSTYKLARPKFFFETSNAFTDILWEKIYYCIPFLLSNMHINK